MIKRIPLFFIGIVLVAGVDCLAQTNQSLDSIFVRAERIRISPGSETKSITVIDAEELQGMAVSSIDELLTSIPGVNVNSRGGFGVQADIGMRGSTFSQVLILLDGMRLNDPLTAHFNHALPIPLSEIDRVEIIRGPASMAYGVDAVGGVIHIHSKGFAPGDSGFQFRSEQRMGSNGTFTADAGAIYREDKLSLSMGIKHSSSDGEEFTNPSFEADNSLKGDSLYSNWFNLNSATISLGYQIDKRWSIHARGAHDTRDFKAKYFYTASSFDDSEEETTTNWVQGRAKYLADHGQTSLNASYRNNLDHFAFNPNFNPNDHETDRINIGLDHESELSSQTRIGVGGLWTERKIVSSDRGNHSDKSQALYGILSYQLLPAVRLQVGARIEHDDNFGTEVIPQAGINYRKENVTLRAEFGESMRAADYTERYVSSLIPNLSAGRNLGNPNLDVERASNYGLGATLSQGKLKMSVDGFFRDGKGLIDFVNTGSSAIQTADNIQDSVSYLYSKNISEVITQGLEVQLTGNLVEKKNLSINGQIAYTFLETKTPDGSAVSKYISNHPKHVINARLRLRTKAFNTTVQIDHTERKSEEVPSIDAVIPTDFTLIHLNIAYALTNQISTSMMIRNLLDEEYQQILGARMPGRWFMVGFILNIKD